MPTYETTLQEQTSAPPKTTTGLPADSLGWVTTTTANYTNETQTTTDASPNSGGYVNAIQQPAVASMEQNDPSASYPEHIKRSHDALMDVLANYDSLELKQVVGAIQYAELDVESNPDFTNTYPDFVAHLNQAKELLIELQSDQATENRVLEAATGLSAAEIEAAPEVELDPAVLTTTSNQILQPNGEGGATLTDENGTELKMDKTEVIACLALGFLLDRRKAMRMILRQIEEDAQFVKARFKGVNPETIKNNIEAQDAMEMFVFGIDKYALEKFLLETARASGKDVYKVLNQLPKDTRLELLRGDEVRRHGGNHQLSQELRSKVLSSMNDRERADLELDGVYQQLTTQSGATTA